MRHRVKKPFQILGGIVAFVLLLASAAYIGGRLLNRQGLLDGGLNLFQPGGGQEQRMNVDDVKPAKELPQQPADVRGLFDHRQDNSVFVGTGNLSVGVRTDEHGNVVETEAEHTGPIVEVIVTAQTIIYKDVTPEGQIQQVVEPGSLDSLGEMSTITVWGRKTDARIITDVFLYTSPIFIK
jgi:hypothetical protein